jgi:hypothetical protein
MRRVADERGVPWRIDPVLTPRDDGDAGLPPTGRRQESEPRLPRARGSGRLPQEEPDEGGTNCGLGRTTVAVDPRATCSRACSGGGPARERADTPLREMWAESAERLLAATVARAANDRMVEAGGALASFPFCPALALQHTGDPLRPDESHRAQAATAERVRLDPR